MLTSLKAMALITLVPAWFLLVSALAPHSGSDPGFDISNGLVLFLFAAGVALLCLGIAFVTYLLGAARSLAAPADCRLGRLTWVCRTGCAGGILFILPAIVLACVRGALRMWHIRLAIGLLTLTGSLFLAVGGAGYCLYLALIARRLGDIRLEWAFRSFATAWAVLLAAPTMALEIGILKPELPPTALVAGTALFLAPGLGIWWARLLWLLLKRLSCSRQASLVA